MEIGEFSCHVVTYGTWHVHTNETYHANFLVLIFINSLLSVN